MKPQTHSMAVIPEWSEIVGPSLAKMGTPLAIVDAKLVIRAVSFAWVEQWRKHRAGVLAKINKRRPADAQLESLVVLGPGFTLAAGGSRGRGRAS